MNIRKKISPNEMKTLRFINKHGHPTYREIAKNVGLSEVASAVYVVNSLMKKGLLEKTQPNTSRSLRITEEGYSCLRIVPIDDLRMWLERDIKVSYPKQYEVFGTTAEKSNRQDSLEYCQKSRVESTKSQETPRAIKISASYSSLGFQCTDGSTKFKVSKKDSSVNFSISIALLGNCILVWVLRFIKIDFLLAISSYFN